MKSFAVTMIVFTASIAGAQTPADLSGHWKGTIEIPNGPVDFEMDLARNVRGEFGGTVTAGNDRVTLPLLKISVEGKQLTFYARTDQPFRGEIDVFRKIHQRSPLRSSAPPGVPRNRPWS